MTDTNAMGTKDGTSVVTSQSALKEAVERVTADVDDYDREIADDLAEDGDLGHVDDGLREFALSDIRALTSTISSQSESLEAMASALEADIATLRHTYDRLSDDWTMETLCLTINATIREARTTLTRYRKTGEQR